MFIGRKWRNGFMRLPNPYALRREPTRESLVFAASQRPGNCTTQEDFFMNFNDECFVLADGVGTMPHGDVAARLACETAIWGYKHIRQHRYYWLDKKLFMKRIFRSTNLSVWQKRREHGFEAGLETTLTVCMIGSKTYWLGYAGETCVWLQSSGSITKLTRDSDPFETEKRTTLGVMRLGLIPDYVTGPLSDDDVLLITSLGCGNYLTPSDIQSGMGLAGDSVEDATRAVESVLASAERNGSTENMTAVIIKRVATS